MNKNSIRQNKCLYTIVFTVFLFFSVSTLFAQRSASVTLKMDNVKMETVMHEIEKQTKYLFIYTNEVNTNSIVSVNVNARPLNEALNQMIKGSNLVYELTTSNIILSVKQVQTNQGFAKVKGFVRYDNGEPVIGGSVIVKGTLIGTTTGIDGSFNINVPQPAENAVLTVSFLGTQPKSITIGKNREFDIILSEDAISVDDVVVTALGIRREEKALSYNVQKISSEEVTAVKDANFMNSLIGKVAGVQINSSASGIGGTAKVVMRGMKSITKSNNALYVIDGIPMYNHSFSGGEGEFADHDGSESAADINPEDIESINMLTGPSAAALYGSDAANGVVIINTKRGMKDRTVVTVSNNTTFSTPYTMPKMQNSYGTSSGISSWGEKIDGDYNPKNFFNTGVNVINGVSVSTGNQKNQTYLSVSTTNTTGILPESDYDRYNFNARNTTSFANDKLVLDIGATYVIQHHNNMVSQGLYYNPIPALYLFPRGDNFDEIRLFERWNSMLGAGMMEQYWPYEDQGLALQNPYWIQKRLKRNSDKRRYMLNVSLKWDINSWLNVTGRVKLDNAEYRLTTKKYATSWTNLCGVNGGYEDQTQHDRSFYGDVMVNINKSWGDWTLNANIGASINDQRFEQAGVTGDLIIANHFAMNNIDYSKNMKPIQKGWHDQTQAIFASAELGWRSMLYLTVTGRNDWASQLAFTSNSSFFYPSVGLSSVISNMFDKPQWLSFLKVRASYSKVASAFARYLSNPSYEFSSQTHTWTKPSTLPAKNLQPESTRSWEIGMNAKFFNKLNFDITYYRSNTYNQTFPVDVPSSSGYNKAIVQSGNIQNYGVEMSLSYLKNWNRISWSTDFTLTHNRNKVIRLASGATNPITGEVINMPEMLQTWLGQENVAPRVILREGGSMTDIYVNHELLHDLNGDIYVDQSSGAMRMTETDMRKVGRLEPKLHLGWSNNIEYRGMRLSMVLTSSIGGLAYSVTQGILDYYGASAVTARARDKGGIPINYGTVNVQNYYQTISTAKGGHGMYYLYSATNVKLQELSLGYTLPSEWFKNKLKVSLNLIGKNLWMIYCKAPFDPELSASTGSNFYQNVDYFMLPSLRNIGFSIKMQF